MTVVADRIILRMENDAVGSGNPAFVHFDYLDTSGALETDLAACIAWISGVGEAAVNSRIVSAQLVVAGSGGALPLSFPVAAYAAIKATNSFLTTMTDYGVAYGSGALTAAGTSVLTNLYTGVAGRSGHGRHFRPYTSAGVVDGSGNLAAAYRAGVVEAFNACFLETAGVTWAPVTGVDSAVVASVKNSTMAEIVAATCSGQVARLRSRRK